MALQASPRKVVPLTTGDVVLVLPERAHWYGPGRGRTWDELYLVFDGPVFDLWRGTGVLDEAHPVHSAPDGWHLLHMDQFAE